MKEAFIIISSESGDYFIIPADKQDDWEEDQYSDDCDYAIYIGGFPQCIKIYDWEGKAKDV